jgi:hemoglobin
MGGGLSTKGADTSLYDRLGGKSAITAVVDDFVGRVAADTRINGKFANANIPRLKMMLVEQICQASGGPCTYTGRDMKTTHAGMGITSPEFDALVGDLVAALNKFKVGEREKSELLAALGPMKSDIVERP